jgi:hypothetical protein
MQKQAGNIQGRIIHRLVTLTTRKPTILEPVARSRGGGPKPQTSSERIARFWSRVNVSDNRDLCWEWQGGKFKNGYGMFNAGRFADGRQDTRYTHRLAYELSHGPIPDGLVVRHDCDNKACCNPYHLQVGTQADNLMDASRRGRLPEERPGAWVVSPELRREVLKASMEGPRGTLARLCRERGLPFKTMAVALSRARAKSEATHE